MNALRKIWMPQPKPPPPPASFTPLAYDLHNLTTWVFDFLQECRQGFPELPEPLLPREFRCLYDLASDEQGGHVLELGTGAGWTTVALAANAPWRTVHTVDFEPPFVWDHPAAPPEARCSSEWIRLIRQRLWNELQLENIQVHEVASQELDPARCGHLGLLFIDGRRSSVDPVEDFLRFHRSVVSGGYIVFRRGDEFNGSVEAALEQIEQGYPEIWRCVEASRCGSLVVLGLIHDWPLFPPSPPPRIG